MHNQWSPSFNRQDIAVKEEKTLLDSFILVKQLRLKFRLFSGGWSHEVEREVICRPHSVGILLYDPKQDEVLLIEQCRIGSQQSNSAESPWLLEIVAGMVEPGELPNRAAYREVREETGYDLIELLPICDYWVSAGVSNERTQLYCGRVTEPFSSHIKGIVEEGEDIRSHVFTTQEAFALMEQGKIITASAIIALQWLQIHHHKVRQW